jgi:hypothetical protein
MVSTKNLKKEIKQIWRDIKNNKGDKNMNLELIRELQTELDSKLIFKNLNLKSKILDKILKKYKEYEPILNYHKNLIYTGKRIWSLRFNTDKYHHKNYHYTVEQVQDISDNISKYLHKKKVRGLIGTAMNYGILGWRRTKFSNIGNDVQLYSPIDSGINIEIVPQISAFEIFIIMKPEAEGGCDDKFNDCLFNCLNSIVPNFTKYFSNPIIFKQYLNVNRLDKIPINKIDLIEKKLKTFKINVRGDYIYTSTIISNKVINLLLINEHYSIDKDYYKNVKTKCSFNYRFEEKKIIMYDKITLESYDGHNKKILDNKEKNKILNNYNSEYLLIQKTEQRDDDGNIIKISIEEEFNQFIELANLLKKETNNAINLYKTGSLINTSLVLFDKLTKHIDEADEILQDECLWLESSITGALIFGEKYEGPLYKYDIKSMYPYLLSQFNNKFPIKRGEFQKLEKFSDYFQFGIYRCIVKPSKDENINKLFRFNKLNYYPHYSLEHAKTLGLEIILIIDEQPNFLFYSREKLVQMGDVFKDYVDLLYPLKESQNKLVKKSCKFMLNCLWGALSEKSKIKYYSEGEKLTIPDDEEILSMCPSKLNDKFPFIKTVKINHPYKHKYARLKTFILSKARKFMCDLIYENRNDIVRCHTDGIYITKMLHNNKNVGIGNLKYEGHILNGKIINSMSVPKVNY